MKEYMFCVSSYNSLVHKMNFPFISIIIPNYCHACYLDERIQSVLNQTYQHFEVIILDDCSPDDGASRAVIEKYRSNPHVSHIIYNENNSGSPFKQWEKGINLAKGELIWIAESDDKCDIRLLEELVKPFLNNEDLVLAFCKTTAFSDDGKSENLDLISLQSTKVFGSSEFVSKYMTHGCPMLNASACLFKKDAVLKIDKQYANFRGAGDRMFWTEISECGDVAVINEWLNYMRFHPYNSTKRNNAEGINQREDKIILDYIYQKGYISAKEYKSLKRIYVKIHIFQMLTDKKLKKELYGVWEFGRMAQFSLKLDAWNNRFLSFFKYKW